MRELQQIVPINPRGDFLVDNVYHLEAALSRLGLRFQISRHGNRNAVERVFREVKSCTCLFSNTFSHAQPTTAERWLQAFAVWWNRAQVNTTERLFRWLIYSLSANDIDSAIRVSASSRQSPFDPGRVVTAHPRQLGPAVFRSTRYCRSRSAAFVNKCEPIRG